MRSLSPSNEPLMADALTQLPYKNRFSTVENYSKYSWQSLTLFERVKLCKKFHFLVSFRANAHTRAKETFSGF